MLKLIMVTARDRKRLTEIITILIRHGLQDIIQFLGLRNVVTPSVRQKIPSETALPERLCAALEELGPTFVKLGQILASRSDLLSPEWTAALGRLHSHASPIPWQDAEEVMRNALGNDPASVFSSLETTPLAAASIGQIHRARLKDGTEVVVKIQRPGLDEKLRADLRLLRFLAESIEQQNHDIARFRPLQQILFLETVLIQELDFCYEAANGEQARRNFSDNPDVIIPKIYWEWSSSMLLVQDYLPGHSPLKPDSLSQYGYDGPHLAKVGANAFMKMVFEHRFYHADPHPGNVMAMPGNKVSFIDFGMVGRLSESRRNELLSLMYAISERDVLGITDVLIGWCYADALNVTELELAASFFLDRQGNLPLQLSKALTDMFTTAREFKLMLPPDLVLLFKALITADGVLHRLDPNMDIIDTLRPVIHEQIQNSATTLFNQRSVARLGQQLLHASTSLPQTLRLTLRRLQHGRIQADVSLTNLEKLGASLERAAMTLAVALLTAILALILGEWFIQQDIRLADIPVLPIISGVGLAAGICWLIWHSQRPH
ncbi:ABC1 kinase family protein [Samsonia erythrinae]|uniref:Ubiquinone biosynthesis protein n=1 Tax=Samsonia erythrinae TaxID=160434 RepID=A0A4R3VLZ0_9GAMM|nr:AarF/UbiB family protein [Samsonia erythrinae]TCV05410.1 ubiquinone biosynthesis protein [Samsonia erythrinae]